MPTRRWWQAPRQSWLSWWPVALASLLLLSLAGVAIAQAKAKEGGRFIYTIDDCYFHMAVAKNLLRHGIWGTSALDGFSSGTSSLLWPLLIAVCFAAFGIHEYWPLVLNLLAGVATLCYIGRLVQRTTGGQVLSLLVLCAVVLLTPLFVVASTGMEHCLQMLLSVAFVDLATRLLTKDEFRIESRRAETKLFVTGALLVMTRYEGLFLVAAVGLLLLCQRRWLAAVLLGVVAVVPITVFGLFAMSRGWYFLPNSLLLKGNIPPVMTIADILQYLHIWYLRLLAEQHMFSLVALLTLALLVCFQRRWTLWNYPSLFLFITLLTTIQHLQFAALGWFYRYEAYLIVLVLTGIGVALGYEPTRLGWRYWLSPRPLPYYAALALTIAFFGPPIWTRAGQASDKVVGASYTIYEQQYQMAHFVERYYQGQGVVANDVGAISYFGNVSLVDVIGLCDIDVLRARRAGTMDNATLRRLCEKHHANLIVIYPEWSKFYGGLLPEWVPVGRWTIPDNVVVAQATVTLYAPNQEAVPTLTRQLQEFGKTMPEDIFQDGPYVGAGAPEVSGTYGPETDHGIVSYCTKDSAEISLSVPDGAPLDSASTRLQLTVIPAARDLSIDVFINDQRVATKSFPTEPLFAWTSFQVAAKWQPGINKIRLEGHGTPYVSPGGSRGVLFRVLDPRKILDANNHFVRQPVIVADAP